MPLAPLTIMASQIRRVDKGRINKRRKTVRNRFFIYLIQVDKGKEMERLGVIREVLIP